jgi:hypothetical protein
MKNIFQIIILSNLLFLNNIFGQDMSINILSVPASVLRGGTGTVEVEICNNDGGTRNLPLNKVRPLISLPSALVSGTVTIADTSFWRVVTNSGNSIRLENKATIVPGDCNKFILSYTAAHVGGPSNATGALFWNGPQTSGNIAANDNSSTGIQVLQNPLPIDLVSFSVEEMSSGNLLDWKTRNENGFSHFSVTKSLNLNEFWEVGKVEGDKKNGKYSFVDKNFEEGTNYYRLKMIDKDGSYKLSNIISITNMGEFGSTTIFPNPSPNRIYKLKNVEDFSDISLISQSGTKYNVEVRKLTDVYEIKVPDEYSSGIYFLQFSSTNRVFNKKIILR